MYTVNFNEQKPQQAAFSGQGNMEVMLEAVQKYKCSYVSKDEQAFEKIEGLVREIGGFSA